MRHQQGYVARSKPRQMPTESAAGGFKTSVLLLVKAVVFYKADAFHLVRILSGKRDLFESVNRSGSFP